MKSGHAGRSTVIALAVAALSVALAAQARGFEVQAFFGKEALPFSWVSGVYRDGNDVWVGTKNGTRIYSLGERSWRSPPAGFAGNEVTGLARLGDSLYVGTEKALNVGGPTGWKTMDRIANAAAANGYLEASESMLWVAGRTMLGGLVQFNGSQWKLLSRGEGTGVMNNITRIALWKGDVWAGTTNNGIFVLKSGKWTVIGPEDGLPGLWITSLAGTGDGMYAGSPDGLGYFDGKGWKVYRVADGLPSDKVSALRTYEDKVVVGTFNRGISVFDGRRFVNIGRAEGLSDDRVESIEVVDGTAWVGTVNGLSLVRIP